MHPVRTSRDNQHIRDRQPASGTQWTALFCLSHLYIGDKDRQADPLHPCLSTNHGHADRTRSTHYVGVRGLSLADSKECDHPSVGELENGLVACHKVRQEGHPPAKLHGYWLGCQHSLEALQPPPGNLLSRWRETTRPPAVSRVWTKDHRSLNLEEKKDD